METKNLNLSDIIKESDAKKISDKAENIAKKVEKSTSGPRIVEDLTEILPMKEEVDGNKAVEQHYNDLMDKAIERVKGELWEEKIKPYREKCKQLAEEAEFNGVEDVSEMNDMINSQINPDGTRQPNLVYDYDLKPSNSPTSIVKDQLDDLSDNTEVDDITNIYRPDVENPVKANTTLKEDMLKGQDIEFDMMDFDNDLREDTISGDEDELEKKLDKEAEEDAVDPKEEEENKRLLDQMRDRVKESIDFNKLDLSKFDIVDKKVSINKTMSRIAKENQYLSQTQSVPLFDTGRTISFTPLSGSDIVKISPDSYSSRRESLSKTYAVMYAHDASIDKNKVSFTQWMKSISAGDILQIYFGLYKSTFAGSNYLAYKCDKCNNFFMVKRDINDMWKFNKIATEEMKKRFNDINTFGEVEDNYTAKTELYQVSENYAVLIHPRNLFNTLEIEYLDEKFRNKYAAIIQPMQYIDKIYYIDKEKNKLVPIDMHPDPEFIVKTIKNKCIVIHKMLSSISVDQYSMLTGKLATLNIKENEAMNLITYIIPEQECLEYYSDGENKGKKCDNVIKESEINPFALLFTHHQLYLNTTLTV